MSRNLATLAAAPATPPSPGLPDGIRRLNMQSLTILHAIASPLFNLVLDPALKPSDLPLLDVAVFCWLHCAPASEVANAYAYSDSPRSAILAKALEWLATVPEHVLPDIIAAISRDQSEVTSALTVPIESRDSKNE